MPSGNQSRRQYLEYLDMAGKRRTDQSEAQDFLQWSQNIPLNLFKRKWFCRNALSVRPATILRFDRICGGHDHRGEASAASSDGAAV